MMGRKEGSNREYICVTPNIGKQLYDYFNGVLAEEEVKRFEAHLFLCFGCQEAVLQLCWIFDRLSEKQNEFFSPKEVKPKAAVMHHPF